MAYNSKYTGEQVEELLDLMPEKQDKLTAGDGIALTDDNVISADYELATNDEIDEIFGY